VGAYLEVRRPAGPSELVPLEGERVTIGKTGSCTIPVAWDRAVSRVHAVLERFAGGQWVIRDLSSRNGTFVNGERLAAERPLHPFDEIRVGDTLLSFRGDPSLEVPTATAATQPPPELTRREHDVLVELCRPMLLGEVFREPATAREIAAALVVSEDAVKQHLRNLYRKFRIHEGEERRRIRLANEAIRRGGVGPSDLRGGG
jgi:hypothetical protein